MKKSKFTEEQILFALEEAKEETKGVSQENGQFPPMETGRTGHIPIRWTREAPEVLCSS